MPSKKFYRTPINSDASYCHIDYDSYDVSNSSVAKKNGCSVRCLRNDSAVDGQSCPGATTVTDYDGNTYYTVQMGDQCWMKQNLKTTHYADGTSISLSSSMSESVTTPYRYYPYSNSSNVNNLGYLYNWKAVMRNDTSSTSNPSGVQGICPNGWHVPSNAEWTQLENYVSSQSEYVCGSSNTNIAKALASTTSWSSSTGTCEVGNTPSTNNATDFSAAPAGSNGYYSFGNYAYFWSATQHDSSYAYFRELSSNSACVLSGILNKRSGLSVRCIRDVNTITDGDPCREAAMVTDYDGNTYNTVKIGGQCWMKQNLKTTHYSDGTSISLGSSTSNSTAYRYNPNGSSSDVSTYGYLYNWEAVMRNDLSSTSNPSGVQGICPTGWHVPSEAEWTQLIDYLSSQSQYVCGSSNMYIAKALASTAYWNSDGGSCAVGYMPSENNATGFTVVPAGYYDGSYYGFGGYAHFWSATQYNSSNAYNRYLNNNGGFVHGSSSNKNVGYSVRCLRDENVPTVTTATVSSITSTSATSGGIVSDDGGASVTARGVCWSKTQNPVIYNAHTIDDSGMGSFASSMTELTPGTTYYVRAYATNSQGTVYGEQRSFTTLAPAVATVSTTSVSSIFSKSATCGGYVAADGGALVTVRGVCWNTSQTPTISNSHTNDAIGTGGFTSSITGLTAGTTYYVRAYATNSAGTAYGSQVCFTTLPEDGQPCPGTSTVIDYDSNTYNTLWIGQQCWMKQNLKTTHYSDGTSISLGSGTSTSTAYRYYPNNSSSSVSTYGYLYNWKAVMRNSSSNSNNPSGVQGICPTGWHVPSDAEWTQLTDYVSNQSQYMCGSSNTSIAKALASTTDWDTYFGSCVVGSSPSSNNTTGFTAVPAGYYYSSVDDFGRSAYFWSTTQYNSNDAYCRYLRYSSASVLRSNRGKGNGLSVRCVRD